MSDSDKNESEGLISKKKIHTKSQESLTSGMTESVITSPGVTRDGKADEDLKLNKQLLSEDIVDASIDAS